MTTAALRAGDRVAFTRTWLARAGARWEGLTGRPFPLNEGQRGTVNWVTADSCLSTRPRTRVNVTWTDGKHRWASVYPRSAVRRVES